MSLVDRYTRLRNIGPSFVALPSIRLCSSANTSKQSGLVRHLCHPCIDKAPFPSCLLEPALPQPSAHELN